MLQSVVPRPWSLVRMVYTFEFGKVKALYLPIVFNFVGARTRFQL